MYKSKAEVVREIWLFMQIKVIILAAAPDFQQCGILTSVDSDEPVQLTFKRRHSNW